MDQSSQRPRWYPAEDGHTHVGVLLRNNRVFAICGAAQYISEDNAIPPCPRCREILRQSG